MKTIKGHRLIDHLFEQWHDDLKNDFTAYKNHACRVFNIAVAYARADATEIEKLAVAAAFHDIGIWTDQTFDYLNPSVNRASAFLDRSHRGFWKDEIRCMILHHHKLTPYRGRRPKLVEAFRRADWLDVCLFQFPSRFPPSYFKNLLCTFPRAGFHRRLTELALSWAMHDPFRPLPMIRL